MNSVFANLPVSVFEVMSRLAREHDAVNLGQGFPDGPFPEDVLAKAADAVVNGWNQYPPMMGLPELRKAVATHYKHWQNLDFDPDSEIMITFRRDRGDRWRADGADRAGRRGGVVPAALRRVPPAGAAGRGRAMLRAARAAALALRRGKARTCLSPRRRAWCCSTIPLNPSATVFPREDLELLARYCEKFDAIAVCDEVWEHVMFDGRRHIPLIAMPGMRERCVKIGSAGKIFSLTGLEGRASSARRRMCCAYSPRHISTSPSPTPPNLQAAVSYGPRQGRTITSRECGATCSAAATASQAVCARSAFPVIDAEATYFVNVDLASLGLNEDDESFCKRLVLEHKVAAIPVSAFYATDPIRSVVRFCFAKRDATLDAALDRLAGALKKAA
jgi:aspartate/methionine/tyrosine aminotransferase